MTTEKSTKQEIRCSILHCFCHLNYINKKRVSGVERKLFWRESVIPLRPWHLPLHSISLRTKLTVDVLARQLHSISWGVIFVLKRNLGHQREKIALVKTFFAVGRRFAWNRCEGQEGARITISSEWDVGMSQMNGLWELVVSYLRGVFASFPKFSSSNWNVNVDGRSNKLTIVNTWWNNPHKPSTRIPFMASRALQEMKI